MALTRDEIDDIADDAVNLKNRLTAKGFGGNAARDAVIAAMPALVACETGPYAARQRASAPTAWRRARDSILRNFPPPCSEDPVLSGWARDHTQFSSLNDD